MTDTHEKKGYAMTGQSHENPAGEKEVLHCAHLARLELTEEEKKQLTGELVRIIDYVKVLQEIETTGIEATFFIIPSYNVMRDDVAIPSTLAKDILKNAPDREETFIKMPRILGND
jgi:aspartyl-tRNA(Asn)/glutamyl-tRNA(Gln) amidotransferase subunit C